jgi:hypothetical protein
MDDVLEAEVSFSASWWESRTSEQLQDMIRGGFAVGEASAGAHREIERRARERARLEKREAELRAVHRKRLGMLSSVEIAMLIALAALLLIR